MLRRRLFFLTCLLCLATSAVLAQDILTVAGGPETHKVLFENDRVRVLDGRLQPGQKVAMHSHPANVVYFLTDAKFKFAFPDGKTAEREFKAGQTGWSDGVTHAGENAGTNEIHLLQVELKGETKKTTSAEKK
jgi:quercetin dioxygenase-like cupin family protein